MRRTSTKRQRQAGERFKQSVADYLASKGATTSRFYAFEIETKAGTLFVSPYEDWIACRFENVEEAKRLLGNSARLNPYSGKWNFHYSDEAIHTSAPLNDFTMHLERLL